MGYNSKNYTEHGGEKTVIGGEIVINGKMTAGEDAEIIGITPVCENQANSEATTIANLKEDFNAFLTKLKTAGLMEADEDTSGGDNE